MAPYSRDILFKFLKTGEKDIRQAALASTACAEQNARNILYCYELKMVKDCVDF